MNKENNFYKLFIIFLLTCFSMHPFILDLKIANINYKEINHLLYRFYLSLWVSMPRFDVIWVILFIFIYYIFYKNYFIDNSWNKIKLTSCIISIIISILLIAIESLYCYNNLSIIYTSFIQIFKCIMVGIGYYLIIYIITRNILLKIKSRRKKYEK